jgi:hypothetical protein
MCPTSQTDVVGVIVWNSGPVGGPSAFSLQPSAKNPTVPIAKYLRGQLISILQS